MYTIIKSEKVSTGDYVQVEQYKSSTIPEKKQGDRFEYVISQDERLIEVFRSDK